MRCTSSRTSPIRGWNSGLASLSLPCTRRRKERVQLRQDSFMATRVTMEAATESTKNASHTSLLGLQLTPVHISHVLQQHDERRLLGTRHPARSDEHLILRTARVRQRKSARAACHRRPAQMRHS